MSSEPVGVTFSQFSLLTRYTPEDCTINNVNLETRLADKLVLKIPMLSAAMTSVTGYDMALALGKAGGIGILPARLSAEEQEGIVSRIKKHDLAFVEDPLTVREDDTIEQVIKVIEKHGYSTIPVVDRFQNFKGVFVQEHYWKLDISPAAKVADAMIPCKHGSNSIDVIINPKITVEDAKKELKKSRGKYLVILDKRHRLVKMAFRQDIEDIKIGIAISTYPGWQERVERNIGAGADLIVVDTSDAYSAFVDKVVKAYKSRKFKAPLCVGNIITYEGAKHLMETGADIVKVGMSSGSICTTQREKAVGRAPMTALKEAYRARRDYLKKTGRHVTIMMDGGIATSADMVIALTHADAIMMGGYFNRFFEAAAPKLEKDKNPTNDESKMFYVETWGEGSDRARNLDRYGHTHRKTFFAEGAEGYVPYAGRLKPNLEKDLAKIRSALSNAGCRDLGEFRKNSVIELNSPYASMVVSTTHHIEPKQ